MKTMKLLLSIVCYFGTGIIYLDQELNGAILELMNISPALKNIVLVLLIVFWFIKILWYIIDKYIQVKERYQTMREIDSKHD